MRFDVCDSLSSLPAACRMPSRAKVQAGTSTDTASIMAASLDISMNEEIAAAAASTDSALVQLTRPSESSYASVVQSHRQLPE